MNRSLLWSVSTAIVCAATPCSAQSNSAEAQGEATQLPPIEVTAQAAKPKKAAKPKATTPAAAPIAVNEEPQELPGTVVERNAPPATGTLGQPPAAYAGGQVATGAQIGVLGNRSIFDTPLSIKAYTAEGIQNRVATSTSQILDTDPSVLAVGRGNAYEYFNIRGFLTRQPYDARFDGLNIPHLQPSIPEFYERIEVIKGPSALLYPQLGGIAGTINYVPKLARDDDITQVTTTITSDSQVRGHLDVGRRYGPTGEWGVRANVVGNTGETYRRDGDLDLAAGSLSIDYRSDRVRFVLHGDAADTTIDNMQGFSARYAGIGAVPVPNPRTVGSFPDGPFYEATSSRVYAAAEVDLTSALTAYAKVGASQTDSVNDSFNDCPFDAPGNCIISPYRYEEYRYYIASEFGLRGDFDTGFIRHRMTVSGATLNDDYRDTGQGYQAFAPFNTNFFNPNTPYTRVPIYQTTAGYFGRTEVRSFAVTDTLSVFDDTIQLTVGARRQSVQTVGAFDGAAEPSYDAAETTPMVGLVVKPVRGLSLYGSYIEALEKGGSASPGAANFPVTLPPAVSKQKEVGAKWDFGSVALTLALFEIERPNDFVDSNNVFGRNGLQENRGVEIEAFGEPIKGLRLIGGVTFLDAEVLASEGGALDGNAPTGAPEFVAKLGGEWDLPFVAGLTLTGLVIHTDEQFTNPENTVHLRDWTRFDAGFRYALTDSIVVRGLVENVADDRYWESADRGFFLNIGAPRTYSLSTTFNF